MRVIVTQHAVDRWVQRAGGNRDWREVRSALSAAIDLPDSMLPYFTGRNQLRGIGAKLHYHVESGTVLVTLPKPAPDDPDRVTLVTVMTTTPGQIRLLKRWSESL